MNQRIFFRYNADMHPFLEEISIDERQHLDRLVEIFLQENAITNLSALRTPEACFYGNVLDSLAFTLFAKKNQLKAGNRLLDIGTGGGFPLLPIAMLFPDIRCYGIDAVGKKLKAIERIAKALSVNNIVVHHERTEVAGRDFKLRETFDIVTARAVAPLPTLLEYCSPFLKVGGHAVLWKSMHIDQELSDAAHAMKELELSFVGHEQYELPLDFGERQLLILKKECSLGLKYPRAMGLAKSHPIMER